MSSYQTLFDEMNQAYDRAVASAGCSAIVSEYIFASYPVRMYNVAQALSERMFRAFSFLDYPAAKQTTVALTIRQWDEAATAVPLPNRLRQSMDGWCFEYEDGLLGGSPDGRYVMFKQSHTVALLDRVGKEMIAWHRSARVMPIHQQSKPHNQLLAMWYGDQGVQVLHSGMVAKGNAGVLFAGPSRAGKTTSSLVCAQNGFSFLGEDFVGLARNDENSFLGHSLFHSVRLTPGHLKNFPQMAIHAQPDISPLDEKKLVFFSDAYPEKIIHSVPVKLVLFPRVTQAEKISYEPISKGKALLRFAYSCLRVPSRTKGNGMDILADLISNTPTYWLNLGKNPADIPGAVENILDELIFEKSRKNRAS